MVFINSKDERLQDEICEIEIFSFHFPFLFFSLFMEDNHRETSAAQQAAGHEGFMHGCAICFIPRLSSARK